MTKNIIRAPRGKDRPYFSTSRAAAQDESISLEARGLLWYLLSKPDNWTVNRGDLQRAGSIGRDKVKRILEELQTAKYLVMERNQDDSGRIVWEYRVHEVPYTENAYMVENEPSTEKPATVKPSTANPQHTEEKNIQSTEVQKEPADKSPAKKQKPAQPHIALIDAYWSGLPAKPPDDTYQRHVRKAKALAKFGITPDNVTHFMVEKYRDRFWQDKTMSLEYVWENVAAWLKKRKPPQAPAPTAAEQGMIAAMSEALAMNAAANND